ncbi:hypothetical protein [Pseudobutyrivibrio sp. LB2011]|uniref:hypothetical protein n=1 Tax=Pseudobutyrivibrio sp. LB2011 TaxID=1408312 RepID=UPI0005D1718C|nr:hypothetical protein [Pseudobutyrivibrio sp. LB2011]
MSIKINPYPVLEGITRIPHTVSIVEDDKHHCYNFEEQIYGFLSGFDVTYQTAKFMLEEGYLVVLTPKPKVNDVRSVDTIMNRVILDLKDYYKDNIAYYDGNAEYCGFYLKSFKPIAFVKPYKIDNYYLFENVQKNLYSGNRVAIGFRYHDIENDPDLINILTSTDEKLLSIIQKEIVSRIQCEEGDNVIIDDISNIEIDNQICFAKYVFELKNNQLNDKTSTSNSTLNNIFLKLLKRLK